VRTEANARDSDVTLILVSSPAQLSEGTQYTIDMCKKHGKEYLVVNMAEPEVGVAILCFRYNCAPALTIAISKPQDAAASAPCIVRKPNKEKNRGGPVRRK
jgi:hypothetical protein